MPMGFLADWLIKNEKLSVKNTRRIFNSIGCYGPAIGLIGLSFAGCDKTQAIIWLCISTCFNGAVYSGYQVIIHFSNHFSDLDIQKDNRN